MQDLVGIIRRKHELEESIKRLADLRARIATRQARPVAASTTRAGTSRWTCATCWSSPSAPPGRRCEREESRGGHTREDFPAMDPKWRQVNLVCALDGDDVALTEQPVPDHARRPAATCSTAARWPST